MMTLDTDHGSVVFNARWWPTASHPITLTADNLESFLRVMYVGLRKSQYNRMSFGTNDVEFRMATLNQMHDVLLTFIEAGYDPAYIRQVFRQLGEDRDNTRLDFPIMGRPKLKRRPDADFRMTVDVPLYPLFQEWAESFTFPEPPVPYHTIAETWNTWTPRPYQLYVSHRGFSMILQILHWGLVESRLRPEQCGSADLAFRADLVRVMDQIVASLMTAGYDPAYLIGALFTRIGDPHGKNAGYWVPSVPGGRRVLDKAWRVRVTYPPFLFLKLGWYHS